MTDGWIGRLSQARYRVWFWQGRSVLEIGVNFFPKEYFWGEHLYQPGKFLKGKTPGGNPSGDGISCGVIQGCHCRDMSELGSTIAPETMAIARFGFKHSRVGSSEN